MKISPSACDIVRFHPCDIVRLHPCGIVRFHPCGIVRLHPCGIVRCHPCGIVWFQPCSILIASVMINLKVYSYGKVFLFFLIIMYTPIIKETVNRRVDIAEPHSSKKEPYIQDRRVHNIERLYCQFIVCHCFPKKFKHEVCLI